MSIVKTSNLPSINNKSRSNLVKNDLIEISLRNDSASEVYSSAKTTINELQQSIAGKIFDDSSNRESASKNSTANCAPPLMYNPDLASSYVDGDRLLYIDNSRQTVRFIKRINASKIPSPAAPSSDTVSEFVTDKHPWVFDSPIEVASYPLWTMITSVCQLNTSNWIQSLPDIPEYDGYKEIITDSNGKPTSTIYYEWKSCYNDISSKISSDDYKKFEELSDYSTLSSLFNTIDFTGFKKQNIYPKSDKSLAFNNPVSEAINDMGLKLSAISNEDRVQTDYKNSSSTDSSYNSKILFTSTEPIGVFTGANSYSLLGNTTNTLSCTLNYNSDNYDLIPIITNLKISGSIPAGGVTIKCYSYNSDGTKQEYGQKIYSNNETIVDSNIDISSFLVDNPFYIEIKNSSSSKLSISNIKICGKIVPKKIDKITFYKAISDTYEGFNIVEYTNHNSLISISKAFTAAATHRFVDDSVDKDDWVMPFWGIDTTNFKFTVPYAKYFSNGSSFGISEASLPNSVGSILGDNSTIYSQENVAGSFSLDDNIDHTIAKTNFNVLSQDQDISTVNSPLAVFNLSNGSSIYSTKNDISLPGLKQRVYFYAGKVDKAEKDPEHSLNKLRHDVDKVRSTCIYNNFNNLSSLILSGYYNGGDNVGATLTLNAYNENSANISPGNFILETTKNHTTKNHRLNGTSDGALTWDSDNLVRSITINNKTFKADASKGDVNLNDFSNSINSTFTSISSTVKSDFVQKPLIDASYFKVNGSYDSAGDNNEGASLQLNSYNYKGLDNKLDNLSGNFYLQAKTDKNINTLVGVPNGILKVGNDNDGYKNIIRSINNNEADDSGNINIHEIDTVNTLTEFNYTCIPTSSTDNKGNTISGYEDLGPDSISGNIEWTLIFGSETNLLSSVASGNFNLLSGSINKNNDTPYNWFDFDILYFMFTDDSRKFVESNLVYTTDFYRRLYYTKKLWNNSNGRSDKDNVYGTMLFSGGNPYYNTSMWWSVNTKDQYNAYLKKEGNIFYTEEENCILLNIHGGKIKRK